MKAYIEVQHGDDLLVTQYVDPARAHEAQQELEYQHGLMARVVRSGHIIPPRIVLQSYLAAHHAEGRE